MNWFTSSFMFHASLPKKQAAVTEHGGCEHVEADPSLLYKISYENDSFGREGYCMCQACSEHADAEEDEEEVVCYDCEQTFKKKDTIAWKWYDFYAPQGDEPLTICQACRAAEKHQARVKRDRADYEDEMSRYD